MSIERDLAGLPQLGRSQPLAAGLDICFDIGLWSDAPYTERQ
jgi:hypothetical protein